MHEPNGRILFSQSASSTALLNFCHWHAKRHQSVDNISDLPGYFQAEQFPANVCNQVSNLIKGALALHKEVHDTFRKTASNFHYECNPVSSRIIWATLLYGLLFTGSMCAHRCPDEFPAAA
jgi:hypothetical protein